MGTPCSLLLKRHLKTKLNQQDFLTHAQVAKTPSYSPAIRTSRPEDEQLKVAKFETDTPT